MRHAAFGVERDPCGVLSGVDSLGDDRSVAGRGDLHGVDVNNSARMDLSPVIRWQRHGGPGRRFRGKVGDPGVGAINDELPGLGVITDEHVLLAAARNLEPGEEGDAEAQVHADVQGDALSSLAKGGAACQDVGALPDELLADAQGL